VAYFQSPWAKLSKTVQKCETKIQFIVKVIEKIALWAEFGICKIF
jgi:hypothetical protein